MRMCTKYRKYGVVSVVAIDSDTRIVFLARVNVNSANISSGNKGFMDGEIFCLEPFGNGKRGMKRTIAKASMPYSSCK